MNIKEIVLSCFLIFAGVSVMIPMQSYAISLDDEEEDREDVEDYLQRAKSAAKNENFSQAQSLLKKAQSYGVQQDDLKEAEAYAAQKKEAYEARLERERQAKLEAERQERERIARLERERERQAQYDASGNKGGSLNCSYVGQDYALYRYCTTGSCDGFAGNYNLHRLCAYDDADALSGNYNIWRYLKNGESGAFTDYSMRQGAEQNAGSFSDRKRFVIYYMRGYIFKSY